MVSQNLAEKAAQSREDSYIVLDVSDKPMTLSVLIEFAESIFPMHSLEQLAITQADEDQFVIAAELKIGTKPN